MVGINFITQFSFAGEPTPREALEEKPGAVIITKAAKASLP
jgi:hypothetical protein